MILNLFTFLLQHSNLLVLIFNNKVNKYESNLVNMIKFYCKIRVVLLNLFRENVSSSEEFTLKVESKNNILKKTH